MLQSVTPCVFIFRSKSTCYNVLINTGKPKNLNVDSFIFYERWCLTLHLAFLLHGVILLLSTTDQTHTHTHTSTLHWPCSSWPAKSAVEESPVMVGAVLLMGGMWGYPGGPIREEMLCLESMYRFPVGWQTRGQWLNRHVRIPSFTRVPPQETPSRDRRHTALLPPYAKLEESYRTFWNSHWGNVFPSPHIYSDFHKADNIH